MTETTDPVKGLVAGYGAASPAWSWNATVGYGRPSVVTFAFVAAPGPGEWQLSPLGAPARAAVRLALDAWAAACGVSFQEVTDTGNGGAAMLRFALDSSVPAGFAAWANLPTAGTDSSELGFKPDFDWNAAAAGNWLFEVMLHEIGHALGLKHPFDTVWGGSGYTLVPWLDDNQNTVMSYSNATGTYRATPGAFDTAAAGYLYGTDLAEQTDGITWSFDAATQTLRFTGSAARETIAGTHARDVIVGGGGDDLLDGLLGDDRLYGGAGRDTLRGAKGSDLLNGGGGNDSLLGGEGRDTLEGGAGHDTLSGQWGDDLVLARADGDLLLADWNGSDTADYRRAPGPIHAVAMGGPDFLVLVTGGGGTDTIQGGYETLVGSGFGDLIELGAGSAVQVVRGGGGDDTVAGGPWRDVLVGGAGRDVFRCGAWWETGNTLATADVIRDFSVSTSTLPGAFVDRLDLSAIDAIPATPGDDAFVFRGTAGFTGAGQIRAQAVAAGTLLRLNLDADTTTTEAMILLKGFADPALLQAADFLL
ncbi:metalloprotease [Caldovatus sediminis]|uniref:Metalloprotease n=1 Tax=Caldovatus sediminis TaxID=2041189 RepID=A0A8J3EDU2_9PROT|nr:matrixin family metalloprotease [Caldovatus sediminis]GGG33893.1 metalloprotease [Caldovatus sediminis]